MGFVCFSNLVPDRKLAARMLHAGRLVIHPDYCGLGLGVKFMNECAKDLKNRGFDIRAKFSSVPVYRALMKDKMWRLLKVERGLGVVEKKGKKLERDSGFRLNVKTYSWKFIGDG